MKMRALPQYVFVAVLAAALLWPMFGTRVRAFTLPNAVYSEMTVDRTVDLYRSTEKQAREVVDGVVNNALQQQNIDGAVDVEAVLAKGDLSSIYELDIPFQEKLALSNNLPALQEQTATLLDRAKTLSQKSALIHQPSDGEGAVNLLSSLGGAAGVDVSSLAGLSNSAEDVMKDLDQYNDQLAKIQEQMDDLQKLWQGMTVILAAKPAFLPEKPDYDAFVVCVDYVGPAQLYPTLFSTISSMAMAELNGAYASVSDQVTATVKEQEQALGRFVDRTAAPITQFELAIAQTGDLSKLEDMGRSAIASQVKSVQTDLSTQFGAAFTGTDAMKQLAGIDRDLADLGSFAGKADGYKTAVTTAMDDVKTKSFASLTDGSPAERQAALGRIGQALGPSGSATVDRYASLVSTAERYPDKKEQTEQALAALRADMGAGIDAKKREYVAKLDQAKELGASLTGKSPTDIITAAAKAEGRVAWREAVNSVNVSELKSRVFNLKNFQATTKSQFDKIREIEDIFKKMTNMTKILDYKSYLKRVTI